MTAVIDESCSTAPERARPALAGRPAAPAPVLDVPGSHRAWVMVAFLLGTMARETPGSLAAGHTRRPPAAGAVALTQGETRVLHYLPTNLSAREIARELFLSVNTIKTHQRHLYAKLGAGSRSQAVERARALGLLAPAPRRRLRGRPFGQLARTSPVHLDVSLPPASAVER
jgi:DNA-binding CsgD family transcriptional regulator